jgi:hypothetical protein
MVMHDKSLELTGFFSRSQGAGRQAGSSHASMPQARRNDRGGTALAVDQTAGRQAGKQLVGRQAFVWYVGRQRPTGLVRRSGMQSVCSLR